MKRETFPMSDSTWQQISRPAKVHKGRKGRCHLTVAENYCTYTNLSQNPDPPRSSHNLSYMIE